MILNEPKFIQFVVMETSKQRITIIESCTKETPSLLATSVERKGWILPICITDRKEYDTNV